MKTAMFIVFLFAMALACFGSQVKSSTAFNSSQPAVQREKDHGAMPDTATYSNLEIAKIGGAGIAFSIGLWQYMRAQRWKRVEFVASEMKSFFNDDAAKAAMLMLDWSEKDIEIHRHRDSNDHSKKQVTHKIAASALDTNPGVHYDDVQSPIREIFDSFLVSLERFESFIEAGVVSKNDLNPYLHYWMKLLSGNDKNAPLVTKELLPQFWTFVAHFRYAKVTKLVSRYERLIPELQAKAGKK